ncbi:MAG: hypothetical protein ABH886_05315 [Candidatus Desantisbacteria bacterium]
MVINATDNQQTDTHKEVAPLAGMSLRNTNNILHTSYAKFLFRNNLSNLPNILTFCPEYDIVVAMI